MAKSRKKDAGLRFTTVARVFVICALLGGAGVGYVYQKEQIARLSQQIHEQEDRLNEQLNDNEARRKQLANMRSPAFLERKIKELNLGLMAPQPTQMWRLAEPPRVPPRPTRETPVMAEDSRPDVARTNPPQTP